MRATPEQLATIQQENARRPGALSAHVETMPRDLFALSEPIAPGFYRAVLFRCIGYNRRERVEARYIRATVDPAHTARAAFAHMTRRGRWVIQLEPQTPSQMGMHPLPEGSA